MELRDTDLVRSPIPADVYISLFVSHEAYLAVSNMGDTPYTLELRDAWEDRVTRAAGRVFTVPAKRMLFLKKQEVQDT